MTEKNYNVDQLNKIQETINKMDPVDIADKLEILPEKDVAIWIKLLNKDLLADAFTELRAENKARIVNILSEESIKDLVRDLDEDELVDTLQELPANITKKLMDTHIDDNRRKVVNELLGYPQESVGSIMTVNFLSVKETDSPKSALDKIMASKLDAEKLEQIWLTDQSLVLIGFVYIADIIRNQNKSLKELAKSITATVTPYEDQEVVAKLSYRYDLGEVPVVDSENRLIGIVPAEDVIDVVHDELQEDMSNITGISDQSESYLEESSFKIAKTRTTWLIICLLTATMTGFIIHRYESLLASAVALTAYIPMLMDSGGNAGSQASTTVITSLYSGELSVKDFFKVVAKEASIGLITGIILVIINFIRLMILDQAQIRVNLTVSITLILTIIFSKVMGGILPLIADKLDVDPTVMAGPLITTVVDTLVLLIYFEVASLLLGI
ncbi:magnesium transporter [Anaerococcus prevotii]|uniref:Magnesium transporter MgtE n=1 Tax=Anaerococcus prevotii ACS-065-V-Col13 TaxID=879305 RepID=F0GUP1_9FIRM|nr:magnesium transporter [Anaerococcus prevotii]EGC82553.1 magnesium transporter [Anaerococcus prevotii ACS-065-V-Col13]